MDAIFFRFFPVGACRKPVEIQYIQLKEVQCYKKKHKVGRASVESWEEFLFADIK